MNRIEGHSFCKCGALTVYLKSNSGKSYSVQVAKNNLHFFPTLFILYRGTEKFGDTYACDHCVNHYGLDLCSCGSGLVPNKCDCGSGLTMQTAEMLEERYEPANVLNF